MREKLEKTRSFNRLHPEGVGCLNIVSVVTLENLVADEDKHAAEA